MIFMLRGLGVLALILIGLGALALAAHAHDAGLSIFGFGLIGFVLVMLFRLIARIDFDSKENRPS